MKPDVIIILSAGTVPDKGGYRSTTYDESDAYGVLGNYARVEAGAFLAQEFPDAMLVTTSKRNPGEPTHAAIMKKELIKLGVKPERIILEEKSGTTRTQLDETLTMIDEHGWKQVVFLTNEYHVQRVKAFLENLGKGEIDVWAAEPIIIHHHPEFAQEFEEIKKRPAYQTRLEAEGRGVEMIKNGIYGSIKRTENDKTEKSI